MDADRSRVGLQDDGAGESVLDPDQAHWQRFAEARTTEAFCRAWLTLQCRMIAGVSGGVVVLGPPDGASYAPVAFWPDGQPPLGGLAEAAERALAERRGLVLKPATGEPYHVAYPIQVGGRLHGVVALDISPQPEVSLQAAMRQLQWGSAWLEVLFRRQEAAAAVAAPERLQAVLDLTAAIVEQDRFQGAAMALATALATRLDADRVSVGFVRGGRVRVRAVSHSADFRREAGLIRSIEAAMDEAVDQRTVIVHPAPPEGPACVTRAHAELARQHGAGAICSVPLVANGRVIGAITLERPADRAFDPAAVELVEVLGAVVGPILEVKRRDDRWVVVKVAEAAARELGRLLGPRHLGRKAAVLLLAGVGAFFYYAESTYRVTAKTVVEAAVQRAVVAPFDGFLARSDVRPGDVVREGQVLAVLDDRELHLERLRWLSQQEQLLRQHRQALAEGEAAQVEILAAQIEQARAQLALLDSQLARTRIRAPFDGVIISGDLRQQLGAPVQRGDVLFEVAPLGRYRVVLQVDERDMDDVRLGQTGSLVLSAFPTERLALSIETLTPVSTPREGRNFFRVEARLAETPDRLRPGMEGVAKVDIDRRRLLWIWTHQLVDWLRLKFWAWLP
jgi:RND family efflux transporter MFP subunit